MIAELALGLAVARADADPGASVRYFLGTWKCGTDRVAFAPLADGDPWTRIAYGGANGSGSAIVGYVASLGGFVFRDFHADGAYAEMLSPGPSDGRWQWTGPYYPQEGGLPLQSRMTYVEISPTRFDRTFEILRDRDFVPAGNDSCIKAGS